MQWDCKKIFGLQKNIGKNALYIKIYINASVSKVEVSVLCGKKEL